MCHPVDHMKLIQISKTSPLPINRKWCHSKLIFQLNTINTQTHWMKPTARK